MPDPISLKSIQKKAQAACPQYHGKFRGFTQKQKLFVKEYLVDLNASQASLRAGYQTNNPDEMGATLMRTPKVAALIQEEMAKRERKTEITAENVLTTIQRITLAAEADGDRSNALKGCELLGKHLKLFADRPEVQRIQNNIIVANTAIAERLREIIGYLPESTGSKDDDIDEAELV